MRNGRPDFVEGNLGLSTSTANKDDTGPQLVLEIALARMVLMPSAVADVHSQQCPWPWRDKAVLREARLQERGQSGRAGGHQSSVLQPGQECPVHGPWELALSPAHDPS